MKRASKAKARKAAKVSPKRSRKVAGKRRGRGKIDFSGWELTDPDAFGRQMGDAAEAAFAAPIAARVADAAKAAVKEAVKLACEQHDAYACMLVEFEPNIRDPLMLSVDVPLGRSEDEEPRWQVSLTDVLDGFIGDFINPVTGKIDDEEDIRRAGRVRNGLNAMVGKLDEVLRPVETGEANTAKEEEPQPT